MLNEEQRDQLQAGTIHPDTQIADDPTVAAELAENGTSEARTIAAHPHGEEPIPFD